MEKYGVEIEQRRSGKLDFDYLVRSFPDEWEQLLKDYEDDEDAQEEARRDFIWDVIGNIGEEILDYCTEVVDGEEEYDVFPTY